MLVLVGAWHASSWVAFFTATGLVLGATYMLWLYRRVMFGEVVNDEVKTMEPMDGREFFIFVPLTILVLVFGVYPMALLDVMETSVQFVLNGLAASGLPLLAAQ
jgi:NADH-quinone oxidoreductase subunit M